MKSRAAVAWEAGKPLTIEEIDVAGPKAGEVLIRMIATGVCHTDAFTLSGDDPVGGGSDNRAIRSRLGEQRPGMTEDASPGRRIPGSGHRDHREIGPGRAEAGQGLAHRLDDPRLQGILGEPHSTPRRRGGGTARGDIRGGHVPHPPVPSEHVQFSRSLRRNPDASR